MLPIFRRPFAVLALLALVPPPAFAGNPEEPARAAAAPAAAEPAAETGLETASATALPDLGWMVGTWAGTVGDEPVEEAWLPAAGGRMVGMFRWLRRGEPFLYELFDVGPHEGGIALLLRHFTPEGLVAWEAEKTPMVFRLETAGEGEAVFRHDGEDGWVRLIYRRPGPDRLTVILRHPDDPEDGGKVFEYRRVE